jgi:hypothetical protein
MACNRLVGLALGAAVWIVLEGVVEVRAQGQPGHLTPPPPPTPVQDASSIASPAANLAGPLPGNVPIASTNAPGPPGALSPVGAPPPVSGLNQDAPAASPTDRGHPLLQRLRERGRLRARIRALLHLDSQ